MLTAKLSRTTMYTKYSAQRVGYLSKNKVQVLKKGT